MSDPAPAVAPNAAVAPGDEANAPAELPGHKVFAGNLAYSTTDEGLKAFFSPVASDIVSTQIIYRGQRSAGYGFVAFNSAEAAQKAVDLLNKKDLDGRTLIVEVAKPAEEKQKEKKQKKSPKKRATKKAKAGDASPTADAITTPVPADNAAENADAQPKPKKKRNQRKSKKTKAAEGEAAVPSTNETTTPPAAPAEPKPRKAKVPKAPRVPRPIGETPAGEPSKTMLFVANLGFSVDDAALSSLFTDAGVTVTSARVVRRRWGTPRRSKGYGFVDVGSEEQQKKALELLQGKTVDGREIAVKIAVNAQVKEAEEAASANATDNATAPATATANAP